MHLSVFLRSLACCCAGLVAASSAMAQTSTTVIDNPGSGTNRIEVTGNTAQNISVQCAKGQGTDAHRRDGTNANANANANSVHVDGRALQGKTVIVTGRNSRDVNVDADCSGGQRGAANVNSVNIR